MNMQTTIAAPANYAAWDAAYSAFRYHAARERADEEFGPMFQAGLASKRRERAITRKYGSWQAALDHPEGRLECEASGAQLSAAESENMKLYLAALEATLILIRTPAPDYDAVDFKIAVITQRGMENHSEIEERAWQIICEDLERLRADR